MSSEAAFLSEKNDVKWKTMYKRLKHYKQRTGSCLIPRRYPDDPKLAQWVGFQRMRFRQGNLREDRQAKLEQIGFVFDVAAEQRTTRHKNNWEARFQELKAFHAEHGHCRVPSRNTTPELKALATWVVGQRSRRNRANNSKRSYRPFTSEEIKKLDSIGFVWQANNFEQLWEEKLRRLKLYRLEHGECRVPQKYDADLELGHWVNLQRKLYTNGRLAAHRIAKLEEIGFEWLLRQPWAPDRNADVKEAKWKDKYDELCEYHAQHGHCLGLTSNGHRLSNWVDTNRRKYKHGKLSAKQVELLNKIDFVWEVNHDDASSSLFQRVWDEMFERLVVFREEFGHCRVPKSDDFEDQGLVNWVVTQRHNERIGSISESRKEKLDSIGFLWDGGPRGSWTFEKQFNNTPETGGDNTRAAVDTAADTTASSCRRSKFVKPSELTRGERVKVYQPDYEKYHRGTVTRKDTARGGIRVVYDNGNNEWLRDGNGKKIKRVRGADAEHEKKVREIAMTKVGDRLKIWWPLEEEYFDCTVATLNRSKNKPFYLEYDDGDTEWVDLLSKKFERI